MFPLNKEIFFSSILSTVEQEKTKDIPKSMHMSTITFVFTARKSFSIKNIDTFEENVVTFFNLQQ